MGGTKRAPQQNTHHLKHYHAVERIGISPQNLPGSVKDEEGGKGKMKRDLLLSGRTEARRGVRVKRSYEKTTRSLGKNKTS